MSRVDGSSHSIGNHSFAGKNAYSREETSGQIENKQIPAELLQLNKAEKKQEHQELLDGSTYLQFSLHKETNAIVVKVLNKNTGEVIKEIPSEKILDIVASIIKHKGLFIDSKS